MLDYETGWSQQGEEGDVIAVYPAADEVTRSLPFSLSFSYICIHSSRVLGSRIEKKENKRVKNTVLEC